MRALQKLNEFHDPVRREFAMGRLPHQAQRASTLSMQLARRLWGIDSRRPAGKLLQIGAALWLELRHSKAEILEAYLNLVPYGGTSKAWARPAWCISASPPRAWCCRKR